MSEITDISTEEKIKEAARVVFTQKGFQGTKIRDIAAQADINLSLVNYYFRSKEKLFQIIMAETSQRLFDKIGPVVNDENTSVSEKVTLIANHYIDFVLKNPEMPFFILSEVMADSSILPLLDNKKTLTESFFAKQLIALRTEGKIDYQPAQIILNIAAMIIFPFISRPMMIKTGGVNAKEFASIMQERKKLIPIWVKQMLNI